MESYQGLQLEDVLKKVAEYCAFSKGKQVVLETKPTFSPLLIKDRTEKTKEALACTVRYGAMPFEGIKDITTILEVSLKDGILSPYDLYSIVDHQRGVNSISNYMRKLEITTPKLSELCDTLCHYPLLSEKIESCISPYGEVLNHASSHLASIRKRLKSVESELNRMAQSYVSSNSSKLMDTIVASRNGRVVVLAKISEKNALGGLIHGESASGQTAYVEPACLLPLNNEKQSLLSEEQEEVERILFECSQAVKQKAERLLDNLETIAILDSLFAMAQYGKRNDGIVAELSENHTLRLVQARHPFVDPLKVVANTYTIEDPIRLLLITGPNTGGKTVSLKILGLFVLMTYCGLPILCESAQIPFFDEVFLDITDDQSIEQSLSTFSAHVSKLALITSKATKKSLVLLDEIGSGTDPKEGESLAIAVLNDLRQKGCMCAATTHFGRLKTYGKKHADILLASVQFDMEKMTPTFRYIEGLTGQSNAFTIAKRFGLKESILKEAENLKKQSRSSEDELIEKLEAQILEADRKNEELNQRLKEVKHLEAELKKEKDAWNMQKENLLDKAELEAQKRVLEIQKEAETYFDELKQMNEVKPHLYNEFRRKTDELIKTEEEIEEEYEFSIGDSVSLKNSLQIGKIISSSGNKFIVEVNGMKITAKKDQLRHRKVQQEKPKVKNRTIVHVKPKISMECNLIGLRVDEALPVFEKYMDDAILAGLGMVRIIHGVGTGALRNAIWANLKKRKDVEYRVGGQGEGGVGATVVTFVSRKS